jgi:hypothetical protein
MWPGMAYYLTLFYPPSRTGKRIGQYFTAAQVSAAVVGLVSAGFQKLDGARGYVGFQWMFLVYGVITIAVGIALLWWLPDRPLAPADQYQQQQQHHDHDHDGHLRARSILRWLIPRSPPALTGPDAEIHYRDLKRVYRRAQWGLRDLANVFMDWRLWPLLVMYFGVVGVGIGTQMYANIIIQAANPALSGIEISLLTAPIWIVCFFPPIYLSIYLSHIRIPIKGFYEHTFVGCMKRKPLTC